MVGDVILCADLRITFQMFFIFLIQLKNCRNILLKRIVIIFKISQYKMSPFIFKTRVENLKGIMEERTINASLLRPQVFKGCHSPHVKEVEQSGVRERAELKGQGEDPVFNLSHHQL